MVRTRSAGGNGDGDIDWAKFLYDDVGELVTEEVSVIPKNIVSERRKRLEGLLSKKTEEVETCVDSDSGEINNASFKTNIAPSVEKRHAVLCFDQNTDSFSIKDLNSTNGTFLNNRRISSDLPEKLNNMDLLRFGFARLTTTARPEIPQNDQNLSRPSSGGEISLGGVVGVSSSSSQSSNVMQQTGGVRGNSLYGSRVSSPSLTLDSGRGSSSAPSSPAKEMSPTPTNNNSNLFYSPNVSRKMTKSSSDPNKQPNRLLYTSTRSRNNSQEQITPLLLRKDSLEDEIDKISKQKDNKSAIIGDLDDLNVPNEVFDEQLEPKQEITTTSSKLDGISSNSRPHSRSGIIAHSVGCTESSIVPNFTINSNAPTNTPTPLYGTPHWWPQTQPEQDNEYEDDDQFSAIKLCDDTDEGDGHSDCRQLGVDTATGPQSINSENNMSMDSDTSASVEIKKKISPMAFTVDFDDDGSKKFGITDSISKFAPNKHRRNISLTKSEDITTTTTATTPRRNSNTNNSDTLFYNNNKKESNTSLTSNNNNKSIIESDTDLSEKQNLSKSFSLSRFNTKGKVVTSAANNNAKKLLPGSVDNNNTKIIDNMCSLSSLKKTESEVTKPKLSSSGGSLFSRLKSSESTSESLIKNKIDPRPSSSQQQQQKTTMKVPEKPFATRSSEKMDNSCKTKDVDKDIDDASSETGTYTVEKEEPAVEKARKSIAKMLGVDNVVSASEINNSASGEQAGAINSTAPEWVREWAEQAAILHKQNKDLNPSETRQLLKDTENVVCAMQKRVNNNLSANNNGDSSHNSDSDDEATLSHSSPQKVINRFKRPTTLLASTTPSTARIPSGPMRLPREASVLSDSGYQVGYQSDSSNDGSREYKNIGAVKMNKAFNIRRGRVGYDSDGCAALSRQSLVGPTRGMSPRPSGSVCSASGIPPTSPMTATTSSFSRNDGGRFSLRMSKSKVISSNQQIPHPPMATPIRGGTQTHSKPSSCLPNYSSSSSNRVDPNGKRRLSQPTTTASSTHQIISNNPNSRKPPTGTRSNSTLTSKEVEMANWNRRKTYNPLKAAAEARKKRGSSSAAETTLEDISPTSISNQSAAFMSKSMSFHSDNHQFATKCSSEEEDIIYVVDEMDSSHSNSPIHIPMTRSSHEDGNYYGMSSHSSGRPKNKLEALDNLVIATIHSLSNKVRGSSRHLLEKLQSQHMDNENGALLEEMVSQLKELELSSSNSSPNKHSSSSRELSGTLKNLKKIEQVILVLDRVLCDDSGSDANN